MMEENNGTTAAPNRAIVILLGVIVLLLVAVVAFFVFGSPGSDTVTGTTATGTGTTGMPAASTPAPFDPATAVKVPAGETPEDYVKRYFDAIVAGDFGAAFVLLPTTKQATYGSEAAFSDQLTGYGVTGYTIDDVTETGEESKVTATATMPGGAFQYLWTFVKDGENWLVKSRDLPGMGQ
jgi:hypothetical protein